MRYVKVGFDMFESDERVSAGLGTQIVRRDHGDQSGASDISITTDPEVAARKLSALEMPEMEKALILVRVGFQPNTISYIMHRAKGMAGGA